mgnify:CR=1 FL=1
MKGAVEVPLPPIVGNGMVGALEYKKWGRWAADELAPNLLQSPPPPTFPLAYHNLPAPFRRPQAGGIHHRALKGRQNTAVGKAVRPPPAGTDALPMAEWIMPTPSRGPSAAGIGASTSEASKAQSPTATAGSRAAQIKKRKIGYILYIVSPNTPLRRKVGSSSGRSRGPHPS